MDIEEIIKSDKDRLFIVDYESYVIYTGEALDDDKPFIRIGSWIDMPVDLIPLTENIIITDEITGNPAFEQFDIDLRLLKSNRYIGSKNAVSRFLNYQRVFNLDLKNASIVEIERDIPELSKEKNISEKNQFIGVFYSNGNFKTVHGGRTIFDLNELKEKTFSIGDMHDRISAASKKTHDDTGFALIDNNPIFFSGGQSAAYLFPLNYYEAFVNYGIDPGGISDIIYPSLNMINLAGFLKWKNGRADKINIHSDYHERISLTKKLFSDCGIQSKDFTGTKISLGKNLTINSYKNSYNLKLDFGSESDGSLISAAFIKGKSGADEIIKAKLDLLLISYSAYEDINLLLKSSATPVAVIDDGNINVAKLSGLNPIVLKEGRYSVKRVHSLDELISASGIPHEKKMILAEDPEGILTEILPDDSDSPEKGSSLINISSILSAYLNSTEDRKIYSRYRSVLEKLNQHIISAGKKTSSNKFNSQLIIFNERLYKFISPFVPEAISVIDKINDESSMRCTDRKLSLFYEKILADRRRLADLLEILKGINNGNSKKNDDIVSLHDTISERKNSFLHSAHKIDSQNSDDIFSIINSDDETQDRGLSSAFPKKNRKDGICNGNADLLSFFIQTKHHLKANRFRYLAALILLMGAIVFYVLDINTLKSTSETPGAGESTVSDHDPPLKTTEKEISLPHAITESDIHLYANRIALLNGYSPIPITDINKKNPHWIYPGNIFKLHDNEIKRVEKGDTLWQISRDKILRVNVEFDQLVKQVESANSMTEKKRLIIKGRGLAVTKYHSQKINELEKEINYGD